MGPPKKQRRHEVPCTREARVHLGHAHPETVWGTCLLGYRGAPDHSEGACVLAYLQAGDDLQVRASTAGGRKGKGEERAGELTLERAQGITTSLEQVYTQPFCKSQP